MLRGDTPIADQPLAVHRLIFTQIQNRHAVADQLAAIFVASAKVNFVTAFGGVGGHGRHHIVSFVTRLHEDRHPQRFEHLMDQRFLCDEFFRRGRAVGFILRVDRFAEGRVFVVEHGEEVIGPMIVEIHDRPTDAENGIRRAAIGGVHRRYPVEHLKDHPVRIKQVDALGGRFRRNRGHSAATVGAAINISWGCSDRSRGPCSIPQPHRGVQSSDA